MVGARLGRPESAPEAYRRIDLQSRVMGADPHGLVLILLDQVAAGIADMSASSSRSSATAHAAARQHALLALHGLETGLNPDAAPDLARLLTAIYRHARLTLLAHRPGQTDEQLRHVAADISGLRDSWAAIARIP